MTAKTKITEKGVLDSEIRTLMTPSAIKELKDLSPTMQQFLLRWQDHRDIILGDQLKEELKDFLQDIYQKDNEMLCKNVTTYVVDQLAEKLKPFYERMGEIAENIKGIKTDINMIKDRLQKDEDFLKTIDKRVQRLEKYASIGWTITRNVITGVTFAIISIGTAIIVFLEIHNRMR